MVATKQITFLLISAALMALIDFGCFHSPVQKVAVWAEVVCKPPVHTRGTRNHLRHQRVAQRIKWAYSSPLPCLGHGCFHTSCRLGLGALEACLGTRSQAASVKRVHARSGCVHANQMNWTLGSGALGSGAPSVKTSSFLFYL